MSQPSNARRSPSRLRRIVSHDRRDWNDSSTSSSNSPRSSCSGRPHWGRPLHDDRGLFELLVLESFQSRLSWLTILRKREGLRRAFDGWDIATVAAYRDRDVDRLLADPGIVRNRAKIEAAIANAVATRALQERGESLDALLWRF